MIERAILANYPREDKNLKMKNKITKQLNKNRRLQRQLIKAYKKGESYYKFSMRGGNYATAEFIEEYFVNLGYRCSTTYWRSLKEIEVVVCF